MIEIQEVIVFGTQFRAYGGAAVGFALTTDLTDDEIGAVPGVQSVRRNGLTLYTVLVDARYELGIVQEEILRRAQAKAKSDAGAVTVREADRIRLGVHR